MDLKGKVAIVAGGSRDIGRAISETLAARGAQVAVNYRGSRKAGEATARRITEAGRRRGRVARRHDPAERCGEPRKSHL